MLKCLSEDVYDDSDCGFDNLGWKIIRPLTSDSTYIGGRFIPDGRTKHAYMINGRYFEGQYDSDLFTIPKSDTLNITSIIMNNDFIEIDTFYSKQRIVFDGKDWKDIGL